MFLYIWAHRNFCWKFCPFQKLWKVPNIGPQELRLQATSGRDATYGHLSSMSFFSGHDLFPEYDRSRSRQRSKLAAGDRLPSPVLQLLFARSPLSSHLLLRHHVDSLPWSVANVSGWFPPVWSSANFSDNKVGHRLLGQIQASPAVNRRTVVLPIANCRSWLAAGPALPLLAADKAQSFLALHHTEGAFWSVWP